MKKYIGISLIAVGLVIIVAVTYFVPKNGNANKIIEQQASTGSEGNTTAQTPSQSWLNQIKVDEIYATVNGKEITGGDVFAILRTMPSQALQQTNISMLGVVVNQLVNDQLVISEAEKAGLGSDKEFLARLEEVKDQLLRDIYVRNLVQQDITDEALRAKFEEILFNTPRQQEVKASHILVKTADEAKAVIERLNNSEDFATVAQEASIGPSASRGGDLGYFTQDAMVQPFAEAAFALELNNYSTEPVETQFGFHVIQINDKRLQPKPEFDAVKEEIRAQLANELIRSKVSTLRDGAQIDLNLPEAAQVAN